ncbi:glutathione S-transferase [Pseudidiomarina terrestris]|uniref:glutathione S-transferase n=1 Tax=Pseudidiomarina terrestris TaxID=2820060 RepID=UPI00264F2496|nr:MULTISPECIES: glutathione S-transferase [unclassified Pseudidiomarina]MDN7135694.1 glutathione S-transferase [Pseudidiomarina sp. 1ASP75-5]MDN7137268.1 glutathione S-transferase [Pseudidiomarina sp. 1ASP75-14]
MKLFGSYTSPFVRHCRIVLAQHEQKFEFVPTDYAQSAQHSPAKRVPFFSHNGLQLHDSSSILRYLRTLAGEPFCADDEQFDLYCLVNTALDTAVNLFLLERDGVTAAQVPYLQRQQARVQSILDELNQREWPVADAGNDAHLRLACFLSWAQFRERLDIHQWPELQNFLASMNQQAWFANTHPALS